jgi:hypothetical protein
MWTRSRLFSHEPKGLPSVERAMLSVVIGIAIMSLLVSVNDLLGGELIKLARSLI